MKHDDMVNVAKKRVQQVGNLGSLPVKECLLLVIVDHAFDRLEAMLERLLAASRDG